MVRSIGASTVSAGADSLCGHRGFGNLWMIAGHERFELGTDRPLKALIAAYQVSPCRGSEPGNAWHTTSALAAIGVDVHVITSAGLARRDRGARSFR